MFAYISGERLFKNFKKSFQRLTQEIRIQMVNIIYNIVTLGTSIIILQTLMNTLVAISREKNKNRFDQISDRVIKWSQNAHYLLFLIFNRSNHLLNLFQHIFLHLKENIQGIS